MDGEQRIQVIVGIGNPGNEYANTRHNLGFMVVDELCRRHGLVLGKSKFNALLATWAVPEKLGGGRALLVQPQSYVNLSGQVAQAFLAFHKILPRQLLVLVDDLALPLGHMRMRGDGTHGGHNGLRDINEKIGENYGRLRLGMGPKPPGWDQVNFVLGKFRDDELTDVNDMISKAANAAEAWLRDGVQVACRFNGPLRPPPPRPKVEKPAKPPADPAMPAMPAAPASNVEPKA